MAKGRHITWLSPGEKVIYKRLYNRRRSKLAHVQAQHKISVREWDARNLDKVRAAARRRHKENPHKVVEKGHRRRSRLAGYSDCRQWIKILRTAKLCFWCADYMENPEVDHVAPLSKGGRHEPSNLVASCKSCNSSKRDKALEEWRDSPYFS